MEYHIKERCIYCGSDVYYNGSEVLLKCGFCGHTLVVAKFENELMKLREAEEEGEKARQALEAAEQEKRAAQERLQGALEALSNIQSFQAEEIESLEEIARSVSEDKENQAAMMTLLQTLKEDSASGDGTITALLQTLIGGQQDEDEKLTALRYLSDRIISAQDDMLAKVRIQSEIVTQLYAMEMDAQERQKLAGGFMVWMQQVREEDILRLQAVSDASEKLLEGRKEFDEKVDRLQASADQIQKNLDDFQKKWEHANLQEIRQLYHQAENFQHDWVFDKAADYYRQVIVKGGPDAEVYWRLLLCHYCVAYQKDDKDRLIPFILNPDLTDPDQMSVRRDLKNAMDPRQRPVYERELAAIDRILDRYREKKDTVKYDVFLSVKQNRDGFYTADSDMASDLYDLLVSRGLKVFNSRRTVIPAGEMYEPYIIAALMSSKVLIVVGNTSDNMNAQWVRNEWLRFQWLQQSEKKVSGKTDRLLFCYLGKGMGPGQIPKALNPDRQAIIDGVKAYEQLLTSLKSVFPQIMQTGETNLRQQDRGTGAGKSQASAEQILNQMTVWLYTGDHAAVLDKYESLKATGQYLDQPQIHLNALCAQKKVADIEQLSKAGVDIGKEPLFQLALKMCKDPDEKKRLQEMAVVIKDPVKKPEKEKPAAAPPKAPEMTAEEWFKRAKDIEKKGNTFDAITAYRFAADLGFAPAQNNLGVIFETGGPGVPVKRREAVNWYEKAAMQGHANGQYNYARCKEHGRGTKKDLPAAVTWYKKAAEQGHARAQYNLGVCLANGTGTAKDLPAAADWFRKAVDQGIAEAAYNLSCLKR